MSVRIDETRDHRSSLQVDLLGRCRQQRPGATHVADMNDLAVPDRNDSGSRIVVVDGDDIAIEINRVRGGRPFGCRRRVSLIGRTTAEQTGGNG